VARPGPPTSGLTPLDAHQHETVTVLTHRETDAVARLQRERIDLGGSDRDRHLLHRGHAEGRDELVADEDEIGGGAGDELALNFVRGGPEDGSPQARREGDQQPDEQEREAPARSSGRVQDGSVSRIPSRGDGSPAADRRR
jgi:hypothetical protein